VASGASTSLQVIHSNGISGAILDTIKAWETARMSGTFTETQNRRLQDIRQEFHIEALGTDSWNLYPVYSSKHTLTRQMQPGQPAPAMWELDNPYVKQPLQFILHVSGDASVADVSLKIDNASEVFIPVTLQAGSILKYSGGDQAVLYDKSWNELQKVKLDASELQIGYGRHNVRFECRFQSADNPEVKLEFRTVGDAEALATKRRRTPDL
jgi:hypothetical protein